MTPEQLAAVAVETTRAHQPHPLGYADGGPIISCSGITDPLDGSFCQFRGHPQEQHAHVLERVTAALTAALEGAPA